MADQFFQKSETKDAESPTTTGAAPAGAPPPVPIETPPPSSEPPVLPSLDGTSAVSDIARSAHRRTRRILLIVTGVIIAALGLLGWLVWRLLKPAVAPNTANQTSQVSSANNTPTANKPEPTLTPPLTGSNSSSAGTAGWPAMTPDFVKNLTYPSPQLWSTVNGWKDVPERFTLQKGVSRFDAGWYQTEDQRIVIHMTTFVKDEAIGTGDIDGDGLADAVALLKWTNSGTAAFPLLYTIMGNQPYDPLLAEDLIASQIGGSYSATKVTVTRNQVNLQLTYPKATDQACCWSGQANVTLRWADNRWTQ